MVHVRAKAMASLREILVGVVEGLRLRFMRLWVVFFSILISEYKLN